MKKLFQVTEKQVKQLHLIHAFVTVAFAIGLLYFASLFVELAKLHVDQNERIRILEEKVKQIEGR